MPTGNLRLGATLHFHPMCEGVTVFVDGATLRAYCPQCRVIAEVGPYLEKIFTEPGEARVARGVPPKGQGVRDLG